MMARLGVTAAMIVTATVGVSQAAFAASSEADVYAGSTALAKAWFNSGANYWVIRDTSCDAKPVYLNYNGNQHFYSGGCNTEEHFQIYGHGYSVGYSICVGNGVPWDRCSGVVWDWVA
jgi:hypothetical protein